MYLAGGYRREPGAEGASRWFFPSGVGWLVFWWGLCLAMEPQDIIPVLLLRLFMSINLTPEQESLIQTKLQTGKYRSAEEVIEIALQLLEDRDRADAEWLESVREKIDDAIAVSDSTTPIDGETFVNQILERFQPAHQTKA